MADPPPPLRRHPGAGDHREGDPALRAQQGRLQGRGRRHQARDRGGGRGAVQGQGDRGQHPRCRRARPSACGASPGRRSDVKKAIVTLAEGQSIDITTGLRLRYDGLKQYNPTSPGPARPGAGRQVRAAQGQAREVAGRGPDQDRRPRRRRPHRRAFPRRRRPSACTARSTSSAASGTSPARSSGWSTIPTAPPSSR